VPVGRTTGALPAGDGLGAGRGLATACGLVRLRVDLQRAGGAVDEDEGVVATASSPGTATTHGMPSWRAMIAVWLVGPPSRVASPVTA
jgi:hypothetical protein